MRRSAGFTLVEILVAVLLTAFVMSLAARMTFALTDAMASIERSAEQAAEAANVVMWLREVVQAINVADDYEREFVGTSETCRFSAALWSPAGWTVSSPVELRAAVDAPGSLEVLLGAQDALVLKLSDSALSLEYLVLAGGELNWLADWTSRTSPPLGLRVTDSTGLIVLVLSPGRRG